MQINLTREIVKKQAKKLKEELKQFYELKNSNALHIVSKLYGFKNWNTASAILPEDRDFSENEEEIS